MEYIVIIGLCIISIVILKIGMNIKVRDIKEIKNLRDETELINLTNKFPENKKICTDILEVLDNKNVKIEETKDEKSQTSLYLVMSNKILIANIKDNCTRIQTIVHECVHSIQNKTLLKFNFIFSNFSILYFVTICFIAIFKKQSKEVISILFTALFLIQFIWFVIRSLLEIDAMTRAEFITKEYIQKTKLLSKKEEKLIENKYKELNKIGIKLYTFTLACKAIIKVVIYCVCILL